MVAYSEREQVQTELFRLTGAGDAMGAERLLRQNLKKDPSWPEAWMELVKLLLGSGRGHDALEALRQAWRHNQLSIDLWCFSGALFTRINKPVEARRVFERTLVIDPTSAFALSRLPLVMSVENEPIRRENLLRWELATSPLSEYVRTELAKSALARQARVGFVEALIKSALILRPDFAEALYVEGVLRYRERDNSGAAEAFRRALFLQPNDPAALYQRGRSSLLAGDGETGYRMAKAALEAGYLEVSARFMLARALRWNDRLEESTQELDRVEKIDPGYAVARRMLEWTATMDDFQR
jgi:tetratricopeptide (TPR) repeat protein